MTTHTDRQYEEELNLLRSRILEMGGLVEIGETQKIFSNPTEKRTEDYISGRFG